MLKWFIRHVTGKCELLRITYEESDPRRRVKRIESSLNNSSNNNVKRYANELDFDVSEAVKSILTLKNVVPEVHSRFEESLKDCLNRIQAYNELISKVDSARKIKYDTKNEGHEKLLQELWSLYQESPLPSRVGPHWKDLGFQGDDPATDFRGMGLLGLQQMIFFAATYPDAAKQVFSQAHHPQYGYSFAIVAINMTGMAFELLQKRKLRDHFYSLDEPRPSIDDFSKVYSYLLHEWSGLWLAERPRDIMEFGRVRDKFYRQVKAKLRGDEPVLQASFQDHS